MFGSKKIEELEAQVRELTESLNRKQAENADLSQRLESALGRVADMEAQLKDFNLEQATEAAKASRAEYEGLKELYSRKSREFDEYKEEEEQRFARDQPPGQPGVRGQYRQDLRREL